MDPALEEKQNNQPQQKNSGDGAIGQGINAINKLAGRGIKNPLGKIGSKAAVQVGRSMFTFLAANPWVWIVLGIIILAVVVFIIVFSLGGPPSGGDNQTVNPISNFIISTPSASLSPEPSATPVHAAP